MSGFIQLEIFGFPRFIALLQLQLALLIATTAVKNVCSQYFHLLVLNGTFLKCVTLLPICFYKLQAHNNASMDKCEVDIDKYLFLLTKMQDTGFIIF